MLGWGRLLETGRPGEIPQVKGGIGDDLSRGDDARSGGEPDLPAGRPGRHDQRDQQERTGR
jgi:hypothetical protein